MRPDQSRPEGGLYGVFQFVLGFVVLALVMLGIGGTIYKLLGPGGWLAQLVGGHLGQGGALGLALGGVAVFVWLAQDKVSPRLRLATVGDWWIYAWSTVGMVYLVLMLVQGSL